MTAFANNARVPTLSVPHAMSLRGKANVGGKVFPDSREPASVNGAAPSGRSASP